MKLALGVAVIALTAGSVSRAQTHSVRDTVTAYGARLNAKGQPVGLNPRRITSRIAGRVDNRLSLRIERYRIDNVNNPTAAFEAVPDDHSRAFPIVAVPPQD